MRIIVGLTRHAQHATPEKDAMMHKALMFPIHQIPTKLTPYEVTKGDKLPSVTGQPDTQMSDSLSTSERDNIDSPGPLIFATDDEDWKTASAFTRRNKLCEKVKNLRVWMLTV